MDERTADRDKDKREEEQPRKLASDTEKPQERADLADLEPPREQADKLKGGQSRGRYAEP